MKIGNYWHELIPSIFYADDIAIDHEAAVPDVATVALAAARTSERDVDRLVIEATLENTANTCQEDFHLKTDMNEKHDQGTIYMIY